MAKRAMLTETLGAYLIVFPNGQEIRLLKPQSRGAGVERKTDYGSVVPVFAPNGEQYTWSKESGFDAAKKWDMQVIRDIATQYAPKQGAA